MSSPRGYYVNASSIEKGRFLYLSPQGVSTPATVPSTTDWNAEFQFNATVARTRPEGYGNFAALSIVRRVEGEVILFGSLDKDVRVSTNDKIAIRNPFGYFALTIEDSIQSPSRVRAFSLGLGDDSLEINNLITAAGTAVASFTRDALVNAGGVISMGAGNDLLRVESTNIGIHNVPSAVGTAFCEGVINLGDGADRLVVKMSKRETVGGIKAGILNDAVILADDSSSEPSPGANNDVLDITSYQFGVVNGFYRSAATIKTLAGNDVLRVRVDPVYDANGRVTGYSNFGGVAIYNGGQILMGSGDDQVDALTGGFAVYGKYEGRKGLIDMGAGNDTVTGFASARSSSNAITEGLFLYEIHNGSNRCIYQKIDGGPGSDKFVLPAGAYTLESTSDNWKLLRLQSDPSPVFQNQTLYNRELLIRGFEFFGSVSGAPLIPIANAASFVIV